MRHCLIIIDIQNDYFPGGTMEVSGIDEAAANARLLLDHFRAVNLPVVHIQHIAARPGATFLLPDTYGAQINQIVTPQDNEIVVTKHFPNSFRGTQLLEILQGEKIEGLVICGAMTHMCIDATTRAAFDLGFSCIVADDACATRDLVFKGHTVAATDVQASFMAALAVPFAKVISTQEVIQRLGCDQS